jgi:hypothetical protein
MRPAGVDRRHGIECGGEYAVFSRILTQTITSGRWADPATPERQHRVDMARAQPIDDWTKCKALFEGACIRRMEHGSFWWK